MKDAVRELLAAEWADIVADEATAAGDLADVTALEQMFESEGWAAFEQRLRRCQKRIIETLKMETDGARLRIAQGTAMALDEVLAIPSTLRAETVSARARLEDVRARRDEWVERGVGA